MITNNLIKFSGIILLTILISVAVLGMVYILQHPQLVNLVATVSWNG